MYFVCRATNKTNLDFGDKNNFVNLKPLLDLDYVLTLTLQQNHNI